MFFLKNSISKIVTILVATFLFSGCSFARAAESIPVLNQLVPTPESVFLEGDDETKFVDGQEVKNIEVTYTDFGFEPQDLEIEPNTRVVFINQTADRMWIKSDQPIYSFKLAIDQKESVRAGEWYSIIFLKEGDWKYLNLLNPEKKGTITIKQ